MVEPAPPPPGGAEALRHGEARPESDAAEDEAAAASSGLDQSRSRSQGMRRGAWPAKYWASGTAMRAREGGWKASARQAELR